MQRYGLLSSLIVTGALVASGLGVAGVAAQERAAVKAGPVTVRVYDRAHKDYHVWNDEEDRTYRAYLTDHHQKYRPIAKLSQKQQRTYWNTRHPR